MTAAGPVQLGGGETRAERVRRFAEEVNALRLPYRVGSGEGRDSTFVAAAPAADPSLEPEGVKS